MEPTKGPLSTDQDYAIADRTATLVMSILHDFIPGRCRREAHQWIAEACFKEGFEITSKLMRKEYEQWKKLQLDAYEQFSRSAKPE